MTPLLHYRTKKHARTKIRREESDGQHSAGKHAFKESHLPSLERGHESCPTCRHAWSHAKHANLCCTNGPGDRPKRARRAGQRDTPPAMGAVPCRRVCTSASGDVPPPYPTGTQRRPGQRQAPNLTAGGIDAARQRTGQDESQLPTLLLLLIDKLTTHRTKTQGLTSEEACHGEIWNVRRPVTQKRTPHPTHKKT